MRRRILPVRAIVVVALLVTAACSGGGDDEAIDTGERVAADADTSSTTTSEAGSGGTAETAAPDPTPAGDPGAEAEPDSTPSPDGTAATEGAQDSSEQGGADASTAPARPTVPKSGAYTFRRTTTDDEGTRTEDHDVSVQRLSGDDRAGRVRITLDSEQGELTNDASVSETGTLVERSIISSPLGEIDCDWTPDWYIHGALAAGSTWTIDTACQDTGTGLEVDVTITGSGSIVGAEEIDVAGGHVTAWVLETTTVTEFTVSSATVNGTQRSESTSRTWIDPARGMQVRDETRRQDSGDFSSGTSEVVSEFLAFTAA